MTLGVGPFALLIWLALAVVVVAPLILVALWLRDRSRGELW